MTRLYEPTDKLPVRSLTEDGIVLNKCTSDWSAPVHKHNFIELVYTFSGKVTHIINGEKYDVSRGSLIFINYNQTHEFKVEGEMSFCNILIQPDFLGEELIDCDNATEILTLSMFSDFSDDTPMIAPFISFNGEALLQVEHLINSMVDEFQNRETGYKSILKSMCEQLLIYMFRQMRRNASSNDIIHKITTLSPSILRYIEENCFEEISMAELARRCYYNPSYFSRIFKKCFGLTFTEFVKKTRVEKAKKLMLESDKSIADIAAEVGYTDRKQFYTVFTNYYGKTPGEFRKGISE